MKSTETRDGRAQKGSKEGTFLSGLLRRRRQTPEHTPDHPVDTNVHKLSDEAPRDPSEVYRSLVNHISIGVFRTTPGIAGRFLEVNPAMEQITGYSREELLQMKVADLYVRPEEREQMVQRVLSGGPASPFEVLFRKKDGTVIVVRDTKVAVSSEDGRAVYLEGFLEDITARKKVEEALLISDAALRSIHEGVIAMDDKFIVTRWNEECERMFGVKASDAVGQYIGQSVSMVEQFPGQNKQRLELLTTRGYNREEQLYHCPAGDVWVDVHAQAIEADGKRYGWVTLATDITERRRVESALADSEQKFKTLAEQSPNMIFINQNGRVVYANKKCAEVTGYSQAELCAPDFSFWRLVMPRDKALLERYYQAHSEGSEVPPYEYSLVTRDGKTVECILASKIIEYEGGPAILGTVTDISETKRAEEALRQSEEKLRMMFQAVAEGVAVVDTQGIITGVNDALLAMYAVASKEELLGKTFADLVAPEDLEKARQSLGPVLKLGAVSNISLTGLKPGGQRISIEVSCGLLKDKTGAPAGSVVTLRDVTETKQMQEQLLAQNRLASIGELVSGVAHEINNPLTGVIGFSELLQQQDIPDDIKEDLGVIASEARRAARIIQDLLTFARKHPPTKQPAKVNSIVEDVLRLRAYEHSVNNVEVVRQFAPDLPDVTVDYHQMQQVFLNVIINAEYFMAEAHKRGRLTITTGKVDGMVRVSFADDGPGIAPANLARVFDPFFTTKEFGKGTGLGLSICHGIVREHRGRISAESPPGGGATFVVELPLDPPEPD